MRTQDAICEDIKSTKATLDALQKEYLSASQTKSVKSSEQYSKRKDLLLDAGKLWATFLKPGDFVKVTGSRTSKFRKIVSFSSNGGSFWGAVSRGNRDGSIKSTSETNLIECGSSKITEYLYDGIWITAKQILEDNS